MSTQSSTITAIKFCGFTNAVQLKEAVELGVDALGFVLYEKSPRALTAEQATKLAKTVPPFVTIVALVVNMPESELVALAQVMPFDVIQFHGDESAQQCQQLATRVNKRWMKALRVTDADTQATLIAKIQQLKDAGACGVLLDAYHPDKFGGTGDSFDWGKIPKNSPLPIILAGGLTPDNVANAITSLKDSKATLYGVDVSGGIEFAKGQKDGEKMAAFIGAVRG